MQAIELAKATNNAGGEKMISTGRRGGGEPDLGGRYSENGTGTRESDCARWRLEGGHLGLGFATASIVRAGRKQSANHLRWGQRGLAHHGVRGLPPFTKCAKDGPPTFWEVKGAPPARHCRMPHVWIFRIWETSEAGIEEKKNPLVEVHRLPGPEKRGTGATLILVGIEP